MGLSPRIETIEAGNLTNGVKGKTTGAAVPAGYVGERMRITRLNSNALSLTTATDTNIGTTTSIVLTAGVWSITGAVVFSPAATTNIAVMSAAVSSVSAALPVSSDTRGVPSSIGEMWSQFGLNTVPNSVCEVNIPTYTVYLSTSQTLYLIGRCNFSISTCTAFGWLEAVRIA